MSWTIYSCGDFVKRLFNRIASEWFKAKFISEGSAKIFKDYNRNHNEIRVSVTENAHFNNQLISCHN